MSGEAGKGDKPRNCFSKAFKTNFGKVDWKSPEHMLDKINQAMVAFKKTNNDGPTNITLGVRQIDYLSNVCSSSNNKNILEAHDGKLFGMNVIKSSKYSIMKVE